MKWNVVLIVDAAINLFLGVVLLLFSRGVVAAFGLPNTVQYFYPTILGAVFLGIAVGLVLELYREQTGIGGIGLGGAIAINLCGGAALAVWLAGGHLAIPLRGRIILWVLFAVLVVVSLLELAVRIFENRRKAA